AVLTALLFAVHPIQTEVASYVSGRSDALATCFYLLSFYFFIVSLDRRKIYLALSLTSFTLSFWSKPIAVTLPVMAFLYDFIVRSDLDFSRMRERKWSHFSFWILTFLFLSFRYFYFGGIGDLVTDPSQKWTRLTYFLTQPTVLLQYVRILVFPIGQSLDHWVSPVHSPLEIRVWGSVILLLAGSIFACYFLRKERGTCKLALFSLLWFFLTLTPTSSFFPINDAMTERRLYLPSVGFFLFLTSVILSFARHSRERLPSILAAIYILALGTLTFQRNLLYQNPLLLWKESADRYPQNERAHYNLGNHYLRLNLKEEAKQSYTKALSINPNLSEPHNNLGILYSQEKDTQNAILHFQKALDLKPDLREARLNLRRIQGKTRAQ
ncbi:MAG: tetratricopeptide repeat protein, partial [Elusimicrobia bacterium]|nr:tetratricopeptide repeat protein [Elusimicrobiota bacterium]